jgi:hypothetical protein
MAKRIFQKSKTSNEKIVFYLDVHIVDYHRKQNLKKKKRNEIERNREERKEKSARARRKKQENCIGLSHHNINMN